MIDITLNGEPYKIETKLNIIDLLDSLSIDSRSVAIELNLEILPKSFWHNTLIKSGDKIELVQFVGGGV